MRRQVGSLGKNSKESYERKGERRKKMLVLLPEGNKIKRGIFFKGVRGNGWEEKEKLENEIKEVKGKSCFLKRGRIWENERILLLEKRSEMEDITPMLLANDYR